MSTDDRDSELDALRRRLAEAEEALDAIYDGAVDALVVRGPDGPQIFTLRGAQEPYRELVERMNEGALTVSADGTILYSNRHFADLVGQPLDLIIGKPLVDFAADCDAHLIAPLLQAGLDRSIRRELALARSDGSNIPTLAAAGPLVVEGTNSVSMIVTDLTERKQSDEIAAAERFARSILEQATDAVLVCDRHDVIIKSSWASERLFDGPVLGRKFPDVMPLQPSSTAELQFLDQTAASATIMKLAKDGQSLQGIETQICTEALAHRHFLLSAGPLRDHTGCSIGSILTLTDITSRKRAEQHQTMLVAELNHRVKNILAIVQSVAWQTMTGAPSLSSFKQAFDGRLKAISLAHDILTRFRWQQVDLQHIVAQILAPHAADTDRATWSGPSLLLPSHVVVPLAMVLHELTTNAVKYGALSRDSGKLQIAWQVIDDGRVVQFSWTERDGPPPNEEIKPGFGNRLIARVMSYDLLGSAELDFRREGLRCTLTFPAAASRPYPALSFERGARASG